MVEENERESFSDRHSHSYFRGCETDVERYRTFTIGVSETIKLGTVSEQREQMMKQLVALKRGEALTWLKVAKGFIDGDGI